MIRAFQDDSNPPSEPFPRLPELDPYCPELQSSGPAGNDPRFAWIASPVDFRKALWPDRLAPVWPTIWPESEPLPHLPDSIADVHLQVLQRWPSRPLHKPSGLLH